MITCWLTMVKVAMDTHRIHNNLLTLYYFSHTYFTNEKKKFQITFIENESEKVSEFFVGFPTWWLSTHVYESV